METIPKLRYLPTGFMAEMAHNHVELYYTKYSLTDGQAVVNATDLPRLYRL